MSELLIQLRERTLAFESTFAFARLIGSKCDMFMRGGKIVDERKINVFGLRSPTPEFMMICPNGLLTYVASAALLLTGIPLVLFNSTFRRHMFAAKSIFVVSCYAEMCVNTW